MARYYEEETLLQSAKDELLRYFSDSFVYTSAELFHKVLANTLTADVVPKSEVEELIRENESLAKTVNEASELIRKLRRKIEKSKSDVAREIFEEIDGFFKRYITDKNYYMDDIENDIAKLKKKYTEADNGETL